MLEAGIPIHAALTFLSKDDEHPAFGKTIEALTRLVEQGHRFSQALEKFPAVFPPLVVHMARAGESSGHIALVLDQFADYIERSVRLQKKIRAAFTYPAMLLLVTLLIVAVMAVFVFPREKEMLQSLGGEMPAITKLLLALIDTVFNPTTLAVMTLLGVTLAISWPWLGKPLYESHLKLHCHLWLLELPLVGPIMTRAASARLLHAVATMLAAGVPMGPPMKVVAPVADNEVMARRFVASQEAMARGDGLYESLAANHVFPPMALQLFRVAEEQGRLEEMARRMACILEEEVEDQLEVMAALLEPFAMLFMGGVIGFVLLASALPTMNLVSKL